MPRYYDDTRMTAPERDQTILELRLLGWTLKAIGTRVGMTPMGVKCALDRIQAGRPGRDPRP